MEFFEHELNLETKNIALKTISVNDFNDYKQIALDRKIWKYYKFAPILTEKGLYDFINNSIVERQNKVKYTFSIIDKVENKVVGSSKIYNISPVDKSIYIGTWLGSKYQKSHRNRESKFLLLTYIFDTLNFHKVTFTTDSRNLKAQKALERIGAKKS